MDKDIKAKVGQDIYVLCIHILTDDNKLIDKIVGAYTTREKAIYAQEWHLAAGELSSINQITLE